MIEGRSLNKLESTTSILRDAKLGLTFESLRPSIADHCDRIWGYGTPSIRPMLLPLQFTVA
jgi:hypothetical protein